MTIDLEFDTLTENTLLVLFTIASAYAYIEAESFTGQVAQFPQLMAGIIFIGSVLLLFRNYLPGPLYSFVAESSSIVADAATGEQGGKRPDDEELTTTSDDTGMGVEESSGTEPSYESLTDKLRNDQALHDMLFTAVATVGYVILSYFISMLLASPLFILAYGFWFDVSKKATVALAAVSVVVIWGFISILYLPMDEGVFVGGLL